MVPNEPGPGPWLDIWRALAAPFHPTEVKKRPQGNRDVPYVTARTVMNRLDEVLGPSNWWDSYTPQTNSVMCHLTIRLPDGQELTKADAGGMAGMADSGDDDKSGFSDSFKRAAVKFGVARYLYRDGVPNYAQPVDGDQHGPHETPPPPRGQWGDTALQGRGKKVRPRDGRELWRFCLKNRIDPALAQWISRTFQPPDYPGRIVDWRPEQVTSAWPEIRQHLQALKGLGEVGSKQ
jgi:hypothetical protein